MVDFFYFARKPQFLMHSFKMKVRCGTRICLPSIFVQTGTLQGPVGLLGCKSLMKLKQSFSDMTQKQKEALLAVKKRAFSVNFPK